MNSLDRREGDGSVKKIVNGDLNILIEEKFMLDIFPRSRLKGDLGQKNLRFKLIFNFLEDLFIYVSTVLDSISCRIYDYVYVH